VVLSAQPGWAAGQLSNTDQRCVRLADEILTQSIAAGPDQIDGLIRCLPGERFYFDKGAARAALVAIGEPAVPALVRALDSTDFTVSEGAAQTLGAMGPKARGAVPALEAILVKKDTPLMAQPLAAQALGKIGEIDFLIRIVEGQEAGIQRHLGAQGLGAAGPAAASGVAALIDMLNSADTATQMYAADALGQIGPAANAAVPRLAVLSKSSFNFVRSSAGEALAKIGTPEAQAAGKSYQRRKALFDGFFTMMSIFVWQPLLAVAVGIGFVVWGLVGFGVRQGKTFSNGALLVAASCWTLYAAWEYHAKQAKANIRIDLLLSFEKMLCALCDLCVQRDSFTSSKGLRYLQIRQARLALSPYSERSIDSASSRSNAGPSASVAVSTSINTIPRQITAAGISTAGPRKR